MRIPKPRLVGSVTVPSEGIVLAMCLGLLGTLYTENAKKTLRALCAYFGVMTAS